MGKPRNTSRPGRLEEEQKTFRNLRSAWTEALAETRPQRRALEPTAGRVNPTQHSRAWHQPPASLEITDMEEALRLLLRD